MKNLLFSLLITSSFTMQAQKYLSKTGSIQFNANSPVEKIEGANKSVACLLDSRTGSIDFVVQVKSFVFEKQLMQEHFNENYLESDKFPKSTLKANITNISSIDLTKEGSYDAIVAGKLTIHGVTKDVVFKGKLMVKSGKILIQSTADVLLSDYEIKIPGAVKDKISKVAKITVNCALDKMN